MNENSWYSTFTPALAVVSVTVVAILRHVWWYLILVCISLIWCWAFFSYAYFPFTYFLLRHLVKSLAQFLIRLSVLLLLSFKNVLQIFGEKKKMKLKSLSHAWLFATPQTVAYQVPSSMGFSRQEYWSGSGQFSSVTQSCPTICNPMNRSTPGLPVHHQLPEFTQTHVHPTISSSVVPFSSCSLLPDSDLNWRK